MWDHVGMGRTKEGLEHALHEIPKLREEFFKDLRVTGKTDEFNTELEKALRIADFFDMGELMAYDALHREESCGGHFREEFQTKEGEALRNDADFMYVAAWEYKGEGQKPVLHKENLEYEAIEVKTRNYK
jgi:succinate dehydrogenase / fumarate reductase flavoprotein subunit